jgi:gamma-glutamyltranspeptidase/glutathione hydrolase
MLLRCFAMALCTVMTAATKADDAPWIVRSTDGVVASDSPEASRIGADVLSRGGNAFDAAVATSLALAVARPQSTGLGGGGFLLAYVASARRVIALDFREVAPAGVSRAYYAELHARRGTSYSPSVYGGNAIGVPGQLAGLAEILRRYGSRPLDRLAAPAQELCEKGFAADEHFVKACQRIGKDFEKWPELKETCRVLYSTLLRGGDLPACGATIRRPELAPALQLIARDGADAVYRGPIGAAMARAAQAAGGKLTVDDLAAYRVQEREPLRGRFGEYEVVTMPSPSSGGICLLETLNILAAARDRSDLQPDRDRPHVVVEAMKHAFADRARWLGDADFTTVPQTHLLDVKYAVELARRIDAGRTLPPESYGTARETATASAPDRGTSHFCIADRAGNIVSMTETVNGFCGSLVMTEPYGIILNNEMDDFATDVGAANLYGLRQGEANAVQPGKRPLSCMTPTLVFRAGKPVLALGGSGGPRIITGVLHVLLNVLDRGLTLEAAIDAPRAHHQWLPNEVTFDREPPAAERARLQAAGHEVSEKHGAGIVQALQFLEDGTVVGGSDPRKDGRPAAGKRAP